MPEIHNKLLCLAIALFVTGTATATEPVSVTNAWINQAPPGIKVNAGYMTFKNNTEQNIDLVRASSPDFDRIEFHLARIDYGVATMHQQDKITLPAGSEFSFSPGQFHMMLFKPGRNLHSGDTVPLQLEFSDHSVIQVDAAVKRESSEHSHHHE